MEGHAHRIAPDHWHPLLMSFREFYGRGARLQKSRLGRGPEEAYAPWKHQGLKGLAGKALVAWSRRKYGGPSRPPEGRCVVRIRQRQTPREL